MKDFNKITNTVLEAGKEAKFKPKLILQILIFIIVVLMIQVIERGVMNIITEVSVPMLLFLGTTIISVIGAVLYCRLVEKRSFYSMGMVRRNFFRDYFIGLGIGFLMIFLSLIIALISNTLKYEGINIAFEYNSIILLILFFWGFVIQGFSEELLLRGYFLVSLNNVTTLIKGVLINSIVFSFLHIFNSGVSAIGILNIFLFGIFASLVFIRTDTIWIISGIHTMWNFAQGNLFGIKVSGEDFGGSVISFKGIGSSLINGGDFGLEGGLAVTVVLFLSIISVYFLIKRRDKEEKMDI